MITVGVTQQTIESITSSSGTLATSGNVTDTTVTVVQQQTSLTSSISENIATPTNQTSSQQIRMCLVYTVLYTSVVYVHATCTISTYIFVQVLPCT